MSRLTSDTHTADSREVRFEPPEQAVELIRALEDAGHEAWIVGGWVRDAASARPDHDVDICTSALWQEVAEVASAHDWAAHETGVEHGTLTVVIRGFVIEVTTFRREGTYSDMRHPDSVEFVDDIHEDLARRDFTVNAMAYHPERGLFDPYDGMGDLSRGLIRCVGEPAARFGEDALRVLRAVRFAARMGFDIEEETQVALNAAAPALSAISAERIGQEMDGILASGRAPWAMREQTRALCCAIPELAPMIGFDQRNYHHAYDVLEHTVHVMRLVEELTAGQAAPELRWAGLLHDVAKPSCFTVDEKDVGHFHGHPEESARMAEDIMGRMAIPGSVVRGCCALIRMHDQRRPVCLRSVRRTLMRMERYVPGRAFELAHMLFNLMRADAMGKLPGYAGRAYEVDELEALLRRERRQSLALHERDLAISGDDVMDALGISPSPEVGEVLHEALKAIMEGELENEREALLAWLHRD